MTNSDNGWRGRVDTKLEDVERRIGEVEKHPSVCPQIKIITDHEERIRKLENIRWQIAGIIALVQALGVGVILETMRRMMK